MERRHARWESEPAATKVPSAAWIAGRLAEPVRELGVEIAPEACERLARYAGLVLDWGSRINLTGARTPEALVDDHLADALALLPHLPKTAFRFVDVGSGAGLPGLVVALLREDAAGVLLEPIGKKRAFLSHALRTLELGDRLAVSADRLAEHLAGGSRGSYQVAVSRAVWPAREWLRLAEPLLAPGGTVLGLEGEASRGDLPTRAERHPYRLGARRRSVVVLRP